MTNHCFTIALTLILFSLSSCTTVEPRIDLGFSTSERRRSNLDNYFSKLTELKRFNGVFSVVEGSDLLLAKAYNVHKDTNMSTHVELDSRFDIHSVSKLLAKAMIFELEAVGEIDRRDPIIKSINDFPKGDKITIQHLMDNTSGLPREPNLLGGNKGGLTTNEIIEWAKKEVLEFEPGTKKLYSNIGYEVLYYIIGLCTTSSFAEHAEGFFNKLDMNNTGSRYLNSYIKNIAQNHQRDGNEIHAIKNISKEDYKQSLLYSTAEDLQKFLAYLAKSSYADSLKNNKEVIAWTGGSDGVRAHVHYNSKYGYSFVLLANYDDIPLNQIIKDTENILQGRSYEMPAVVQRKRKDVAVNELLKYEGKYDFVQADHTILEFKVEDGQLVIYQEGEKLSDLTPVSKTTFYIDLEADDHFQFIESNDAPLFVKMSWKGINVDGSKVSN